MAEQSALTLSVEHNKGKSMSKLQFKVLKGALILCIITNLLVFKV